jgi:hypothetical protein
MKRRPFVQGTSNRKQVLRQRRIHTSFAETWEMLKNAAEPIRKEPQKQEPKPA